MNKHIELVKKWLDDPFSVTKKELKANKDAACDARYAADVAYQATAAAEAATAHVTYWVNKYEELTNE